ncbi:uncharacterized protein E5676_scaffold232G001000 [Cucumis melo var. makuwa]|uniref:DUF4216 domain-containing protein n=1 Tax=Cucumis melo var. makuwa TaxID=1194695 RepID=A0A5D3BH47_CUCMM|nr:uncharacterized protein E5676_scaffold232G001000 [Cucumis melo var. makuwa]
MFDGRIEEELPPKIATSSALYGQLQIFDNCWGKREKKKSKSHKESSNQRWKKRSIFFDIPYWKELPVRHNLDVMHVKKNVCQSIIGTLLDINGKSKDGVNARKDLQLLKIRPDLYPQDCGGRTYLPPALHTLWKSEKKLFCSRLYKLKLTDGYSSNISKCVSLDECKVMGLKSHDYHVLMQQLLSVVLRGLLPKGPRHEIYRLCSYFNRLCQRIIDREVMLDLGKEVVDILCLLERMHMNELMVLDKRLEKDSNLLWKIHREQFPLWLKSKIELDSTVEGYSDLLKWLANGPRKNAMSYTGYIINGKRFHIKSVEKSTQNSSVVVDATTLCRSSAKDKSQVMDANVRNGVKVEEGFTLVNLHQSQSKFVRKPFILASQAKQVFYARENDTSNWYIILKAPPRGFHDLEMYVENYDDTLVSNENISNAVEDVDESELTCKTRL